MKSILFAVAVLFGAAAYLFNPTVSDAQTFICKKTSSGGIAIRARRCRRGETKVTNVSTLRGPAGPAGSNGTSGTDGADGQLRIYGDGSAGALNVTGFETLDPSNPQYTSCTVGPGATLNVASGTVLRCSGNVSIQGFVIVSSGAIGGGIFSVPSTNVYTASSRPANPGRTRTAAANGELGNSSQLLTGAPFTFPMGSEEAKMAFLPGPFGGGGGGGSLGSGSAGGGYFAILAGGSITLASTSLIAPISSAPSAGSGGGGGPIVVLASKASITIPAGAAINVSGNSGGGSSASSGPGGGGGGGGIYILSPNNTVDSSGFVLGGGSAGANSTQISTGLAVSGAAGGASVGSGGAGGDLPSGRPATASAAQSGGAGSFFQVTVDPTALF